MMFSRVILLFILFHFAGKHLTAQYQVLGSATSQSCHCYTITPAANTQNGSVWNVNTLNLTQNFDIAFDVFLGCADVNGADGIAFVLQPNPTATGMGGGSMGYQGIPQSLAVVVDTYQNSSEGDPAYDHLSININGDISHNTANNLAGPVQAIFGNDNIENCDWHVLRITWNAATQLVSVYFGGSLRTQATVDLVNTVFGGNPVVYWGMVGATGGLNNLQRFCARLNASFDTNVTGDSTCTGFPVTFNPFIDALIPITGYWWNFGDGTTSTQASPPPHPYTTPGVYNAQLVITGADGCVSDTSNLPITILPPPIADFTIPLQVCEREPFRVQAISVNASVPFSQYVWYKNDVLFLTSTITNPEFRLLDTGLVKIDMVAITNYQGCSSPRVTKYIRVLPKPVVTAFVPDGCVGIPPDMGSIGFDPANPIAQWHWYFSNGVTATGTNPVITFNQPGNYDAFHYAVGANGCVSDTVRIPFKINSAVANAGNDTTVNINQPFILNGSGNGVINLWQPAFGLNDATILRPSGQLAVDTTYTLTVTTFEGCIATDDVRVRIFKGSKIFMPTAFTPNGDGVNDLIKPVYIGMKEINRFNVYNRWGQLVYSSREQNAGWDGRLNGKLQPAGNYVYTISATDNIGQVVNQKGYFLLIK